MNIIDELQYNNDITGAGLVQHFHFCLTATPVTIGLQQTAYSVYETDEYQVVCAEVLSGDIAGRNIEIDYITTSDTASMYTMLKIIGT